MTDHGFFKQTEKQLVDHVAGTTDVIGAQTPAMVEMQRRLVEAIRAASDSADAQAVQVIGLTQALKVYTVVLAVIGVVQIALMIWKG
jgi:hypothetical protein